MSKNNQTANEAQLKARRTSLGKKTNDELITIILRKDKSERSLNSKIQELTALLKEADELNEEKATRILGFEKRHAVFNRFFLEKLIRFQISAENDAGNRET